MLRTLLLATIVGLGCWACAAADDPRPAADKGGASEKGTATDKTTDKGTDKPADTAKMSDDERAVRAAVDAYAADFDKGDAKAVASHFAEDAQHVDDDGNVMQGRKAIEEAAAKFLAKHKGAKLELKINSLDVLKSGVAIERGVATIVGPKIAHPPTNYVAIHAKSGDQWLIQSIQNLGPMAMNPTRAERLGQLEWLIGQWAGQDNDATINTTFAWTANKSFITASFSIVKKDKVEIAGTQIIGWDPETDQIRSWVFDSMGGFGQGVWSHNDDRWTVTMSGTTEDGRHASSVGMYTREGNDGYEWQASSREVAGEMMPDIEPVKLIRVREPAAAPKGN